MKENKHRDNKLIRLCKDAALKINGNAVDEFEIYAVSSVQNEIKIFNGMVESLSFSDSSGIGVRVFKHGSVGYAYTAILDGDKVQQCIEKAIFNSKITNREEYNFLPRENEFRYKQKVIDDKVLFREDFLKFNTKRKIDIAKRLETLTREKDKRVVGVDDLIYHDNISEVAILNSLGFCDKYKTTTCFVYVNAISRENGDTSTGDFFNCARSPGDLNLEEVAENAVKRSVSILDGKKVKSQRVDIILDPLVASQFLGVIADGLTADSVQKGKSLFKDKIGEKIFAIDLDILDDGTMQDGLASKPFDEEGVTKGKTLVIKNGILNTFLHNTYTARKDGTTSTGNAVRASYKSSPSVGLSNFYISPSDNSFEELLKCVDCGLYVIDIIGLHSGTNPVSGDISVGAKGLWIEKGSFKFPVKEVTIATDILNLCKSIDKVGNDLRFIPSGGYIGSPSLLVRDIMVSGI